MLWHCALPALEALASDSATGKRKKKGRNREGAIGAEPGGSLQPNAVPGPAVTMAVLGCWDCHRRKERGW